MATVLQFSSREGIDADLLATRRAWLALEGWQLVREFPATKGEAKHTVYCRDEEWRCTCASFVYVQRKHGGVCRHIEALGGKGTGRATALPSRPAPAVAYNPAAGDDLTALLAASMSADAVWVPECWDWLLDGEMPTPSGRGVALGPDVPNPSRGDRRTVSTRIGAYDIEAHLRSGNTTYWIEWVVKQTGRVLYQGTADGTSGEYDFGIPEELELPLPDGTELKVAIKRYRTERPANKRRRGRK